MSDSLNNPPNNDAVLTVAQIIKSVMSSSAKSELEGLYVNFRKAISAHQTLIMMGHPNN